MLMYKINIHQVTWGRWRNRKHKACSFMKTQTNQIAFLSAPEASWENTTPWGKHKWRKACLKREGKFVTLPQQPPFTLPGTPWPDCETTLNSAQERHAWTLWAIIWLLYSCLEDLFLSCMTWKAEGMGTVGTPTWCIVVTTHRTGKDLLKSQRLQCWRSSCAINRKQQVFNCESANTQTLHIPRIRWIGPTITAQMAVICVLHYKAST